jgi:hypothetical protein
MSMEGLRAWIGEVERKLGKRTRVFLALATIAIGLGGAAIYLAIDARESSVSETDVQALQEQLEGQIGTGEAGAAGTEVAQLEAELKTLQADVAKLKGESDKSQGDGGTSSGGEGSAPGEAGGEASSGTGGPSAGGAAAPVPDGGASSAKAQELLEQAKEQNAEAEAERAGE